jgi:hypothetical protein
MTFTIPLDQNSALMNPRKVDLYIRQIHEGGAKVAEFLRSHPQVNPNGIDDMTQEQELELMQYCSDLTITHQIERGELDIELHESSG